MYFGLYLRLRLQDAICMQLIVCDTIYAKEFCIFIYFIFVY